MRISKFHQSMKKDGLVPQAKSGRNKGILRLWREGRRQAAERRQRAEATRRQRAGAERLARALAEPIHSDTYSDLSLKLALAKNLMIEWSRR